MRTALSAGKLLGPVRRASKVTWGLIGHLQLDARLVCVRTVGVAEAKDWLQHTSAVAIRKAVAWGAEATCIESYDHALLFCFCMMYLMADLKWSSSLT